MLAHLLNKSAPISIKTSKTSNFSRNKWWDLQGSCPPCHQMILSHKNEHQFAQQDNELNLLAGVCYDWWKPKERIGASNASLSTISSTFNSLFKVLCIFPSRYLCAIGLSPVFSFGWNLPPHFGLHSQTTRLTNITTHNLTKDTTDWAMNGIVTLHDASFQRTLTQVDLWVDVIFQDYNSGASLGWPHTPPPLTEETRASENSRF